MNQTWQGMVQAIDASIPIPQTDRISFLAQVDTTQTGGGNILTSIGANLGTSLADLARAIVILVVGLLIAVIASAIVKGILSRTNMDNRLGRWMTGQQSGSGTPPVEKWISSAVFWVIFIFTLVAFLQALQLTAVSEPLNNFLNQIIGYLPELVGAAILLAVAWLVATIVKLLVTRSLRAFKVDERLGQVSNDVPSPNYIPPGTTATAGGIGTGGTPPPPPTSGSTSFSLSDTIGNTLYWFIFLLFLPSILSTLGLQGTLAPVQQLLNNILSILPNVIAAILIGAIGWLIAQVVRRIVTNFLAATGTDRIGANFGLGRTPGRSLSWIIGTIAYVLVLIPTAIAALNALRIDAISVPAISMLNQILNALPQIFTAVLVLIAAYALAKFIADLVTSILGSIGFDNVFYWLGLQTTPTAPPPLPPPASQPELGQTVIQPTTPPTSTTPTVTAKSPSEIVGIIVLVGIMLFATVAAVNILNIPALTALISGIVVISGRVLSGLIVFAIGLYLANLAFNLITSSGGRQTKILGQAARISIIALVSAMALQQMGIASDIVNLAFGLLVGAIAVAIALAFGLGGRDVAAEQLREWLSSFKNRSY